MPRYEKDGDAVETSDPTEGARLRAAGFVESKARTQAVRAAEAEQDKPKPNPKQDK